MTSTETSKNTILLGLSFAAVYVLWGSTYLALRIVLESMPPFLMASFRFILAGSILLFIGMIQKQKLPTIHQFKNASLVGILLLVIANGGVVWAEQYINSGITALIVTIEPIWVVFMLWVINTKEKPSAIVWLGISLGLAGMLVLVGPVELFKTEELNTTAVMVLVMSSFSWALGSVVSTRISLPESSFMSTAIQMLSASACMQLLGTFTGEWSGFSIANVQANSWLGFAYLVIFGSLLGFSSYAYLVKNASPTSVSTHAYINPVIAVFLGWWLGNERVGSQTIIAALLLVTAVVLIITKPKFSFGVSIVKKIK